MLTDIKSYKTVSHDFELGYIGRQTFAKDMAANWKDKEVFQLISCWSEEGILFKNSTQGTNKR